MLEKEKFNFDSEAQKLKFYLAIITMPLHPEGGIRNESVQTITEKSLKNWNNTEIKNSLLNIVKKCRNEVSHSDNFSEENNDKTNANLLKESIREFIDIYKKQDQRYIIIEHIIGIYNSFFADKTDDDQKNYNDDDFLKLRLIASLFTSLFIFKNDFNILKSLLNRINFEEAETKPKFKKILDEFKLIKGSETNKLLIEYVTLLSLVTVTDNILQPKSGDNNLEPKLKRENYSIYELGLLLKLFIFKNISLKQKLNNEQLWDSIVVIKQNYASKEDLQSQLDSEINLYSDNKNQYIIKIVNKNLLWLGVRKTDKLWKQLTETIYKIKQNKNNWSGDSLSPEIREAKWRLAQAKDKWFKLVLNGDGVLLLISHIISEPDYLTKNLNISINRWLGRSNKDFGALLELIKETKVNEDYESGITKIKELYWSQNDFNGKKRNVKGDFKKRKRPEVKTYQQFYHDLILKLWRCIRNFKDEIPKKDKAKIKAEYDNWFSKVYTTLITEKKVLNDKYLSSQDSVKDLQKIIEEYSDINHSAVQNFFEQANKNLWSLNDRLDEIKRFEQRELHNNFARAKNLIKRWIKCDVNQVFVANSFFISSSKEDIKDSLKTIMRKVKENLNTYLVSSKFDLKKYQNYQYDNNNSSLEITFPSNIKLKINDFHIHDINAIELITSISWIEKIIKNDKDNKIKIIKDMNYRSLTQKFLFFNLTRDGILELEKKHNVILNQFKIHIKKAKSDKNRNLFFHERLIKN